MKRARPWVLGAALILGAGAVSAITPSEDSTYDAFLIRGDGEGGASSRTLNASVRGASFAQSVVSADGDWEADGNWLVIEVTASAPRTEVDAEIVLAALHVDGLVFHASERVPDSLLKTSLHVGTSTAGMLAFELPNGVRSGVGELRLISQYSTPQLDDVVVLPVILDAGTTSASIELREPEVTGP